MTPARSGHCSCWAEVSLHDGHCCFAGELPADPTEPLPCGHQDTGMKLFEAYQRSRSEPPQDSV